MKKLAIMMAALCMGAVTFGAVSENTVSELGKISGYIKTRNITALRTLAANAKTEIKAEGTRAQKIMLARAMVWSEILSNVDLTFAQMCEFNDKYYKEMDIETKAIPYFFVDKKINPATTDAQLEQAITAFKQADIESKLSGQTGWFINAMIAAGKSQEAYDLVTAAINSNEAKYTGGMFYALANLSNRIHGGMTPYIAKLYFKLLANNSPITKQARFLTYANSAISKLVTDPDTDLEAFKKQLQRIRLIYTNRMTTDAGKKLYGEFVSIIDNTIKSL